jgi:hypothetical protein
MEPAGRLPVRQPTERGVSSSRLPGAGKCKLSGASLKNHFNHFNSS